MNCRQPYNKICMAERLWFLWQWKHGHSIRNIARQTGRSPTTVRKWVKRLSKEEHQATKGINDKLIVPIVGNTMTDVMRHSNVHMECFYPMNLRHSVSNEELRNIGFTPYLSSGSSHALSPSLQNTIYTS